MRKLVSSLAFVTLFTAGGAVAQTATPDKDSHSSHHPAEAKSAQGGYTEGEVRKVDKEAGKITLKHGAITNLEMPGMTMVFRAGDPAMLDRVKAGDKVRFKADRIGGALTVTEIQPAP